MSHSQPPVAEQSTADTSAVTLLLKHDAMRSIIARYMTVEELVMVRRVSSLWRHLFDQPCCWRDTFFEPTPNQLDDEHLRLDKMPWLEQLRLYNIFDALSSGEVGRVVIPPFDELLSNCRNLALRKLTIQGAVNAAIIRAMPRIEKLTMEGLLPLDSIPFLSTQLRDLQVHDASEELINTLLTHQLPHLQHIGSLHTSPNCLQRFAHAHPHLTSITLLGGSDHSLAVLVGVLASLDSLTALRIECVYFTEELMEALCALPRLQRLTLIAASQRAADGRSLPSAAFWAAIPTLSVLLLSHLTEEQDAVELRIISCRATADCNDEWWDRVLLASLHCTELGLKVMMAPSVAWQRFMSQARFLSASMLRRVSQFGELGAGNFSAEAAGRLVSYIQVHAGLTCLELSREITEEQLFDIIACQPDLVELGVSHGSAVTMHRALAASGSLAKLKRLTIFSPSDDLPHLLCLLGAARSLRSAYISVPTQAWDAVSLQQAKACTQHIPDLSVNISHSGNSGEAHAHEQSIITSKLLLLPQLSRLSLDASELLTLQQMAEVRRQAGLSSVHIDDKCR